MAPFLWDIFCVRNIALWGVQSITTEHPAHPALLQPIWNHFLTCIVLIRAPACYRVVHLVILIYMFISPFQTISLVWHSGCWEMVAVRGLWNSLGSLTLQSPSSDDGSRGLERQRNFWGRVHSRLLSLWKEAMKISFLEEVFSCMYTLHCLGLVMQRSCWETLPLAEHSFSPWNKELLLFLNCDHWLLYLVVWGAGDAK